MKILALDCGGDTGWATGRDGTISNYATEKFKHIQERPARLAEFTLWLERMIVAHDVDVIVYERPFCRGLHATRYGWGYAGIVEAIGTLEKCAVLDVNVATLKKSVGISGSTKPLDWVKEQGYVVKTDHEADAIALAIYAMGNIVVEA